MAGKKTKVPWVDWDDNGIFLSYAFVVLLCLVSMMIYFNQEKDKKKKKKNKPRVFISFSGEDSRKKLLSHLRPALDERNIDYFVDENIEKGNKFPEEILKAIATAEVAILIISPKFSERYWCAEELNRIVTRCENQEMTMLPIFYEIGTYELRRQGGLEAEFSRSGLEEVQAGLLAEKARVLAENYEQQNMDAAADTTGWVFPQNITEYELVQEVAGRTKRILDTHDQRGYTPAFLASVKDKVTPFSSQDIKKMIGDSGRKITTGCYSQIYVVHSRSLAMDEPSRSLAMDELSGSRYPKSNEEFLSKVRKLAELQDDNLLVGLQGFSAEIKNYWLVYQYIEGASLRDKLEGSRLSWLARIRIAVGVARGLQYLHNSHLVHTNVTSTCVLLFENSIAKLACFNLSHEDASRTPRPPMLSTCYEAPECQKPNDVGRRWTKKMDVYGFGVILLELLTGKKPSDQLKGKNSLVQWAQQNVDKRHNKSTPEEEITKVQVLKVAKLCLKSTPQLRPNMTEVVKDLVSLLLSSNS